MCFLALVYNVVPEYPVIVAANRDEHRDRPSRRPAEIRNGIWAGTDLRAGGTWLGMNRRGLVVGVSNLAPVGLPAVEARSRGLLCLDMLGLPEMEGFAETLARQVRNERYNNFNLLAASSKEAWLATYIHPRLQLRPLDAGVYVIANSPPEYADDPKVNRGRELIGHATDMDCVLDILTHTCADHGVRPDGSDAICVHGERHGTLSSSIIAIHRSDCRRNRYFYADGNPCSTEYEDLSGPVNRSPNIL